MLRYVVCLARLKLIVMNEDYKLVIGLLRSGMSHFPMTVETASSLVEAQLRLNQARATTFNATLPHTSEYIPRRERSSTPRYGRHYRDAIHAAGHTG